MKYVLLVLALLASGTSVAKALTTRDLPIHVATNAGSTYIDCTTIKGYALVSICHNPDLALDYNDEVASHGALFGVYDQASLGNFSDMESTVIDYINKQCRNEACMSHTISAITCVYKLALMWGHLISDEDRLPYDPIATAYSYCEDQSDNESVLKALQKDQLNSKPIPQIDCQSDIDCPGAKDKK